MTEWRWLDVFARHLRACALGHGEVVAVLSESASRPELVETSRIAAQMLGGRVYDVVVPTPASSGPVALRSTGASVALAGNLLHAPELGQILGGGARVLMISNEHPENFERYLEDPTLARRVRSIGRARIRGASPFPPRATSRRPRCSGVASARATR